MQSRPTFLQSNQDLSLCGDLGLLQRNRPSFYAGTSCVRRTSSAFLRGAERSFFLVGVFVLHRKPASTRCKRPYLAQSGDAHLLSQRPAMEVGQVVCKAVWILATHCCLLSGDDGQSCRDNRGTCRDLASMWRWKSTYVKNAANRSGRVCGRSTFTRPSSVRSGTNTRSSTKRKRADNITGNRRTNSSVRYALHRISTRSNTTWPFGLDGPHFD